MHRREVLRCAIGESLGNLAQRSGTFGPHLIEGVLFGLDRVFGDWLTQAYVLRRWLAACLRSLTNS